MSDDGQSLRELARVIDERDRRYEDRFTAQEKAVFAALAAQEKLTGAAFAASEKAIVKAEAAQQSYNERTNELRGTLSDQALTLLARTEAEARFAAVDEKVEELKASIAEVRDILARGLGKDQATDAGKLMARWVIGLAIATLVSAIGIVLTILARGAR